MNNEKAETMKNALVALVDAGIRSEKHLRRMCPGASSLLFYAALGALAEEGKIYRDELGYCYIPGAGEMLGMKMESLGRSMIEAFNPPTAQAVSVRKNYAPHSISALLAADTLRRSGWETLYHATPEKMHAARASTDVSLHVSVINARFPDHATSYDRLIVRAMFDGHRIPEGKRIGYVQKICESVQKIAERTQSLNAYAHRIVEEARGDGNAMEQLLNAADPLKRGDGPDSRARGYIGREIPLGELLSARGRTKEKAQAKHDAIMSYLDKRAKEICNEYNGRKRMLELYSC